MCVLPSLQYNLRENHPFLSCVRSTLRAYVMSVCDAVGVAKKFYGSIGVFQKVHGKWGEQCGWRFHQKNTNVMA